MNKIKLITKILVIIIITLISFIGIYVQKYGKMTNIVKDYDFSKDLKGYRQIVFEVSDALEVLNADGKVIGNTDDYDDDAIKSNSYKKTENKINKEDNLNKENYEKSKKIIEKRLNTLGVQDYTISLDKQNGLIYIQVPEDENTDKIVSNISETGKFEMKDSKDNTVYITGKNLKKVSASYNTTESGTTVYLRIQLDKEGTDILKNLTSNDYAKKDTSNTESKDSETEKKEEEQKELVLAISGKDVVTTSFEKPIQNGEIDLSIGKESKDVDEIDNSLKSASTIATLLETGELPLTYQVTENQYVNTDISDLCIRNTIIISGVIAAVLLVFMAIKYKLKGILSVISIIGFTALYLLLIRYTNVAISISGAMAIGFVFILDYLVNMKLLSISIDDKKQFRNEYIKIIMKIVPILIISILAIFMRWATLVSFGMLLFWGIALMILYNILVTKSLID